METLSTTQQLSVITSEQLLEHWQGHRSLTRKVIEAFPEDELFRFSVGNMRPFAQLAQEMIDLAGLGIEGIVTRDWPKPDEGHAPQFSGRQQLLERWDAVTDILNRMWPQIPAGRFQEEDLAFGSYPGLIFQTILYFIDNEIHHRAQGYVYLRALGVQPPFFWER